MKKVLVVALAIALCGAGKVCIGQTSIPYGSNNGKYQVVNGTKMYYEEYGKGVPLLLIHGGFASIKDVSAIIPALSKKFRVIAVDCPGQGRSEQADSLSFQLMADYFSKMIDLLKLDSVYVLGHSDGAHVSLLLAADRPDKVKRTAAFAAVSEWSGYYPEAIAGLDKLTPEIIQRDFDWWLKPHLRLKPPKDKWEKFIQDYSKMCSKEVVVPEDKLKKISTRVLVIQGDNDIVKSEHSVKLQQSIKGSQLCIIPAASHFVLLERLPLFNSIVIDFFTTEMKLFDWTQLGK